MKRLLLIKHGSLGDIISSTSVIIDVKNHFKKYEIFLLTTSKYKFFFHQSNIVDEILIDDRNGIFSIFNIIKLILSFKFEIIIDLQNSQRTSVYAFLIRLFSNSIINGTSKFVNSRYKYSFKNLPSVIDGLSNQVELLGVKTTRKPQLNWLDTGSFNMNLLKNKNYFLINPGCSKKNIQKRWSAFNYAKVCKYLISMNVLPIVIGSKEDEDAIKIIHRNENRILNLINKSPLEVVYQLSKNAIGAISNDTGPAHLIAASGCMIHLVLSDFSNIKTVIPQGSNVSFTQKKNIEDILVDDVIGNLNLILKL